MIFLKLLLNIILLYNIISIGAIASSSEKDSRDDTDLTNAYRLPNYIIPYHYSIKISWPDEESEKYFFGLCEINIKIIRPTHKIRLHAQRPQIDMNDIFLEKKANSRKEEFFPRSMAYNDKSHILELYFDEIIPSGNYSINMTYTILVNDDNKNIFKYSYINNTGNKIWLYAMHFQTIGARQIFPCLDEPKFKATFNILIYYPNKYMLLSNMNYETISELIVVNGWTRRWMRINIPIKISTYQVAFCIITDEWFNYTLTVKNDDNVDTTTGLSQIIVWKRYKSKVPFAVNTMWKIVTFFANNWKNIEKVSNIQFVLLPSFTNNIIEKWGLIFNSEAAVSYDEKLDSLAHKIEVAYLTARQVTYQWLSITVSPSWWKFHWLNQGISTLIGIDVLDEIFADFRMSDLFVVQMQQESLRLDNYDIMKPLLSNIKEPSEINSLLSFSYYTKAPAILRMLRYVLTDDIFREGVENFYKTQSTTFNNFCKSMQNVYNKREQSHPFIIKDIMAAWSKHDHYPTLKVKRNSIEKDTLIIEVEHFFIDIEFDWWIPITITKQTESNFSISANWHGRDEEWMKISFPNYLKPYRPNFFVQEDEWYIINIQQMGYYRVNYDFKNWKNIARYLDSAEYTNIHVLNRAQIIDDAYHFMMRKYLNFSIFFRLTKYLWRETDYVAWYPMFKALEDMSRIFPFPDKEFNIFKTTMLNSLNMLLQNIDYDKKPGEKSDDLIDCLRQEASKWACVLDAPSCTKTALIKLQQYFISPKTNNRLLPWWRHWTFCNGLKRANSNIWNLAQEIHIREPNVITAKFLACSTNSTIIIDYIKMTLDNFNKEMGDNYLYDFYHIIDKHANNSQILNNILRNLKIPRDYIVATIINIINHVYSTKLLNELNKFLTVSYISEQYISYHKIFQNNQLTQIDKLVSLIQDKIERRNSEISRVQTFKAFLGYYIPY